MLWLIRNAGHSFRYRWADQTSRTAEGEDCDARKRRCCVDDAGWIQVLHPIGLSEDPAELPEGVEGENWDLTAAR